MPTLVAVPTQCPKCSGALWDNRLTKKNPKQPDFKCRNRACDGVVWPPRNGEVYADQVAQQPIVGTAQAHYPPVVNNPGNGAALSHGQMVTEKLNELMGAYDLCFTHAQHLAKKASGPDTVVTVEGISAIAATIFIAAREKGLV